MKPKRPKEVPLKQFHAAITKAESDARELADRHNISHCLAWWFTENETCEASTVPCIYKYPNTAAPYCPTTRTVKPKRLLPTKFKHVIKKEVQVLQHFSTAFCASMTLKTTVKCFAKVNNKYYICEHKVGSCPWKEVAK